MSTDSLAILRKNASEDITKLAEDHINHDLSQVDRDTLKQAANKIGTHATIGSVLALGWDCFLLSGSGALGLECSMSFEQLKSQRM